MARWSCSFITDNRQIPLKAFHDKTAHESIRTDNLDCMVVDIHG